MDTSGDEHTNGADLERADDSDDNGIATEDSVPSTSQKSQVGRKSLSGQICSLKTLIDDQILDPGNNVLTMDYFGAKFDADLLPNGNIRWSQSEQIFSTPSAWFNHCKKLVNPESTNSKPGSAWSSIRYRRKRLDSYKLRWYRKQKKIVTSANIYDSAMAYSKAASDYLTHSQSISPDSSSTPLTFLPENYPIKEKNVVEHHTLASKLIRQDTSVMVKCIPFSALERIQPFALTLSTNALLTIDFHCHLTTGEVVGYLGGSWDITSHNLSILQAFPCKTRLGDKERSLKVTEEIRKNLEQKKLSIVGWYHSHPKTAPQPTIRDIEAQMEYQIAMKGENDSTYIPCIGLICSPYDDDNPRLTSRYQAFWVMPPNEFKPLEYGRPMQMTYSITRDSFLTQDLLLDMRLLAHYYIEGPDAIKFEEDYRKDKTYWHKLQSSLKPFLPRDLTTTVNQTQAQTQVQQQALSHFWAFLKGLIIP
ncbi:MPN domain-containing protein [Tetranychus urticae]|uniref:MPN domain-containing protein n=1 Tax=Tetranychus urticae TaxID=32264 RepID=T1JTJ8_TETUR|nr:MPN domain-containing protein [Tetranychus urticae]